MQTTKTNRPKPPDELDGEGLLEWVRVVGELETAGRLDVTDRAILTLYVETWAVHRAATAGVARYGPIIKYPNGMTGPSPFYKVQKETGAQLRGLIADLGLNPAARGTGATAAEPDDLEI